VSGERINILPQVAPVSALDWGNNGLLAVGNWGFAIYDTNAGQYIYTVLDAREIAELSWSPDGTKLLLVNDSVAEIRDFAINQVLATLPNAFKLAWSPAGNQIAAAGINEDTNNPILQIWDVSALPDLSGTPTLTPYATIQTPRAVP
jgi:WD40 repeat protein